MRLLCYDMMEVQTFAIVGSIVYNLMKQRTLRQIKRSPLHISSSYHTVNVYSHNIQIPKHFVHAGSSMLLLFFTFLAWPQISPMNFLFFILYCSYSPLEKGCHCHRSSSAFQNFCEQLLNVLRALSAHNDILTTHPNDASFELFHLIVPSHNSCNLDIDCYWS